MIKIICAHCGHIAETGSSYFVYYTGRSEVDGFNLCKKCFDEFLNWVNNKTVEDKPVEEYERVDWDGKAYIRLL